MFIGFSQKRKNIFWDFWGTEAPHWWKTPMENLCRKVGWVGFDEPSQAVSSAGTGERCRWRGSGWSLWLTMESLKVHVPIRVNFGILNDIKIDFPVCLFNYIFHPKGVETWWKQFPDDAPLWPIDLRYLLIVQGIFVDQIVNPTSYPNICMLDTSIKFG